MLAHIRACARKLTAWPDPRYDLIPSKHISNEEGASIWPQSSALMTIPKSSIFITRSFLGGHTVLPAIDVLSGIGLIRNHSVDAIVLDFAKRDGDSVAQVLMKEQPELPVVSWSGRLDAIPESLKGYADALLEKTEGPEALVATVERLINAGIVRTKAVGPRSCTLGKPLAA